MKTKWKMTFALLMIVALISGCFGEKKTLEPLKDGKGKIKVMSYNEEFFNGQYGNSFSTKYPDIEVEVISTLEGGRPLGDEGIKKLIEKHKPDVLLLNEKMFASYAQDGKLYSLDKVIAEEKFDVEGYKLGMIDRLRVKGNGTLYALAPSFHANVLYYNRDLFEKNQIDLPRNKMSWEEVFELSKRFKGMGSGKNQVFGLYQSFGDTAQVLQQIADTFSLQLFDLKAEKVVINSDGWKAAVKLATDAARSKTVSFPAQGNDSTRETDFWGNHAFLTGKAAMIVDGPYLAGILKDPGTYSKKVKKINWDMVTVPVDPKTPDESAHVKLFEVYAISADSPNKSAAWELMKFINGSETAKISSRSIVANGLLPTRDQFFKDIDGKSTEPFYMLKFTSQASGSSLWGGNLNVPDEFYKPYNKLLADALKAIIDNKKTVDKALAELEVKAQDALTKAREAVKKEENAGKKQGS